MLFWISLVCVIYASLAYGAGDGVWVVGQKFQITLSAVPDAKIGTNIIPTDAEVWDFDLFDGDAATIAALQAQNKVVVCYFSAGTYEPNRPDGGNFTSADKGASLAPQWPDEYWLNIKSANVRKVIQNRIKLAAEKGCDAVDPDNMDAYDNNGGGLGLTQADAISYMTFMAGIAAANNLAIGLKNALQILSSVQSIVQFAVNEECAYYNECNYYSAFLAAGKPVFHIEYPNQGTTLPASTTDLKTYCTVPGITGLSTVMKHLSLDGQVEYCDGSLVNTPTKNPSGTNPWAPGQSHPSSRTTRTTGPTRTSSAARTTSTPERTTRTTSSSKPTSTTPGNGSGSGNGCTAKHWDQCGGQNWNGCTVCASGLTCKGVSPPYYYQCL